MQTYRRYFSIQVSVDNFIFLRTFHYHQFFFASEDWYWIFGDSLFVRSFTWYNLRYCYCHPNTEFLFSLSFFNNYKKFSKYTLCVFVIYIELLFGWLIINGYNYPGWRQLLPQNFKADHIWFTNYQSQQQLFQIWFSSVHYLKTSKQSWSDLTEIFRAAKSVSALIFCEAPFQRWFFCETALLFWIQFDIFQLGFFGIFQCTWISK